MPRTFIRQDTQIRKSDSYDDTITPSATNYETNPVSIEDDLNSLRSQVQNFLNRNGTTFPTGNWYDDLSAPGTFEFGTQRGINKLNTELHELERKRVLTQFVNLTDVFVSGGNNFTVLAFSELPSPNIPNPQVVAVGTSILTGTVASSVTIGSFSLTEVAGATAISPKNLCTIVTGSTRDPLLSSGRVIYGLFQTDKTDGQTLVGGDAQLSFVRINSTGDDLEAVPFADIENKHVNYSSVTRKALEDLSEQDFLRGAEVDVPSAQAGVSRQNTYDNQGAVPVDVTTNSVLDLEANGIYWEIRSNAESTLFRVTDGNETTNTILVDTAVNSFDVNAQDVDFDSGIKVDTGGTDIHLGVNAGVIETLSTSDLIVKGAGELYFDDGNQPVSWAQTNGIKLSDSAVEWSEFESAFDGEVSLLKAISDSRRRDKVYATVNALVAADNNVSGGVGGNLDVVLPYLNSGSFLYDYDVFLNGELLRPGANAAADNDYYPGDDEFSLKFEFPVKSGDVICVVPYVRF